MSAVSQNDVRYWSTSRALISEYILSVLTSLQGFLRVHNEKGNPRGHFERPTVGGSHRLTNNPRNYQPSVQVRGSLYVPPLQAPQSQHLVFLQAEHPCCKKASIFAVTTDERKRWILEYVEVAQLRWLNSAPYRLHIDRIPQTLFIVDGTYQSKNWPPLTEI